MYDDDDLLLHLSGNKFSSWKMMEASQLWQVKYQIFEDSASQLQRCFAKFTAMQKMKIIIIRDFEIHEKKNSG